MRTWKRCWRSYESQPARRPKAARHSCSPSFPRRRESSGFALGRMEKSRVHGGAIRGKAAAPREAAGARLSNTEQVPGHRPRSKIGRASGRERGCQSVEIPVVAETLKKTKTEPNS